MRTTAVHEGLLSIVIPAFNEEQSIASVINSLLAAKFDFLCEIIVVDDGSTDRTAELAERCGIKVVRHPNNLGYGAALKTGMRAASGEYVMTMDADGQHRVEEIRGLWQCAEKNDLVIGARKGLGNSPLWRFPGKVMLSLLANYITRKKIPDLNSGMRIFRRNLALKYLHVFPSGFSLSTTSTITFLNRGYRVAWIPIETAKRTGTSTVSLKTGFDTIILILRLAALFDPLRIFLRVSLLNGILGLSWGLYYVLQGRGVTGYTVLVLLASVMFLGMGLICDQISQLRLERYE
jgi:glycosyltransferase involved in cell wall biosynthesis